MKPHWLSVSRESTLPSNLVKADENVYVGRALHEGDTLPASVMSNNSIAFVSKNGQEFSTLQYELLLDEGYTWQPCEWGYFPPLAKDFNDDPKDQQMFIGRVNHNGTIRVGKVDPSLGTIRFPFEGKEVSARTYDVLVLDKSRNWIPARAFYNPSDAVVGGYSKYDRYTTSILYVGRSIYNGQWQLANVLPNESRAFIHHNGEELYVRDYQLLCGSNYRWHMVNDHFIPPNAVSIGTTSSGEPLYISRSERLVRHILGTVLPDRRGVMHHWPRNEYEVLVDEF